MTIFNNLADMLFNRMKNYKNRSMFDKLSDIVSVKDYGGLENTDIGPVINSMISSGILSIYIPEGVYYVNTSININVNNVSIFGAGHSTILKGMNADNQILILTSVSNIIIENISLVSGVDRNIESIKGMNTFRCTFSKVFLVEDVGKDNTGIYLDGCNDTHITDCELHSSTKIGKGIYLTGSKTRCEDTYITTTNIVGYNVGIYLEWSSGNYFTSMDVLSNSSDGILFAPESNHEIDGTRCVNVLSDSNIGNGWNFYGVGSITETSLCGCWGATNGTATSNSNGLVVGNQNVDGLAITSFESHSNTANGIALENGSNIVITSSTIFHNALNSINKDDTTGSYFNGIIIDTNVSFVNVSNNIIGRGGINVSQTPKEFYGIDIESNKYIVVPGNIINQAVIAPVLTNTSGDNLVVFNNLGSTYQS